MKIKKEKGKRYGYLTVISLGRKGNNGCYYWVCQCDCGNYSQVRGDNLRSGKSKMCRDCYAMRRRKHK